MLSLLLRRALTGKPVAAGNEARRPRRQDRSGEVGGGGRPVNRRPTVQGAAKRHAAGGISGSASEPGRRRREGRHRAATRRNGRRSAASLFLIACSTIFSAAATVSRSFPPFLRAVAELDRPVCIYIFLHFGRKCFHTLPRPAAGRTATRHFDRSVASGEIRPATEAGRTLRPWASTARSPDFSAPPRPEAGAPVEMTKRGGGAMCHEMS